MNNKMFTACPICGREGLHYWHHVYNGSNKKNSELYNAIIYPCSYCHTGGTESIHKQQSQELNMRLKQQHQKRIMEEFDMTLEKWVKRFGKSWL